MPHGGRKEFSGADTCVYVPPVKCADEARRRDPARYVSRVKLATEADVDVLAEERVVRFFPELLANGSVTVFEKKCVPEFQGEDFNQPTQSAAAGRGCQRVDPRQGRDERYLNLLTGRRTDALYKLTDAEKRERIRHALIAAVALVPDFGPWIIHVDAHLGNVLYYDDRGQRLSSLADWGRTIMIDNPSDFDHVRQQIVNNQRHLDYEGYPQNPPEAHNPILTGAGLRGGNPTQAEEAAAVMALRGFMAFVLISQVFHAKYIPLLTCQSQGELLTRVNQALTANGQSPIVIPARQGPGIAIAQGRIVENDGSRIDVQVKQIGNSQYRVRRSDGDERSLIAVERGGNGELRLSSSQRFRFQYVPESRPEPTLTRVAVPPPRVFQTIVPMETGEDGVLHEGRSDIPVTVEDLGNDRYSLRRRDTGETKIVVRVRQGGSSMTLRIGSGTPFPVMNEPPARQGQAPMEVVQPARGVMRPQIPPARQGQALSTVLESPEDLPGPRRVNIRQLQQPLGVMRPQIPPPRPQPQAQRVMQPLGVMRPQIPPAQRVMRPRIQSNGTIVLGLNSSPDNVIVEEITQGGAGGQRTFRLTFEDNTKVTVRVTSTQYGAWPDHGLLRYNGEEFHVKRVAIGGRRKTRRSSKASKKTRKH